MGRKRTIDYDVVRDLTAQGWGQRKIAAHLNTDQSTVQYARRAMGIEGQEANVKGKTSYPVAEAQALYDTGLGLLVLSKKYAVSMAAIRKHIKTDPTRQNQPTGLTKRQRRPFRAEFSPQTKQARFIEEGGCCQECHKPIGDGTNFRLATYHHIHLVANGGGSEPSNCMVMHHECHNDPEIFKRLHGFNIDYRPKSEPRRPRGRPRKNPDSIGRL